MRVHELDRVVLNTPDVERALAFYTGLLEMEGDRGRSGGPDRCCSRQCG